MSGWPGPSPPTIYPDVAMAQKNIQTPNNLVDLSSRVLLCPSLHALSSWNDSPQSCLPCCTECLARGYDALLTLGPTRAPLESTDVAMRSTLKPAQLAGEKQQCPPTRRSCGLLKTSELF